MALSLVLAAVALLALQQTAEALVPSHAITFAANATNKYSIAPYKGQLNVSVWFAPKSHTDADFVKHVCNGTAPGAACNQPRRNQFDTTIQIRWAIKNATAPYRFYGQQANGTLTTIEGRLCYQTVSFNGRPWRKKNKPYPHYTQNCPGKMGSVPFTPNGQLTFDLAKYKHVPNALFFVMLWVHGKTPGDINGDENVVAYESTENTNTMEAQSANGVTSGMTAACIVLTIVGPVYYFVFYFIDNLYFNKYGRGIKFLRDKMPTPVVTGI